MSVPSEIFKAYDVRGLYGDQIDGDVAEQVGRAFVRVLADLGGKAPGDLRVGPGARHAPHGAGARRPLPRRAWWPRAPTVLDAGMVGTEMLYFLVGSRGLDGGLMCTASHNPKAYTGAKLVREGAIALSGDEGIQDIRRLVEEGLGEPGAPDRAGSVEEVDIAPEFRRGGDAVHRPGERPAHEGRRRRRQRHGRPDGRPAARPAADRARRDLLGAGRQVPRPRAQPAAAREPAVHHRQGARGGRGPRASPGTATRTAASSSTTRAGSSTGTS